MAGELAVGREPVAGTLAAEEVGKAGKTEAAADTGAAVGIAGDIVVAGLDRTIVGIEEPLVDHHTLLGEHPKIVHLD